MSRPSDFRDDGFEAAAVVNPRLGPIGWMRWAWRQLTSMRTALLLLLALAIAAVPGSLIPQESADPNGVIQWRQANPGLVKVVEALQGFDVYTSAWFSAIYLLLFLSLVGCVVPRVLHHYRATRAAPPRTPSRFDRLPASRTERLEGERAEGDIERAVASAERLLRRSRYRVVRYGTSVSAERGYLRETGNLLFHSALVGVLISVFVGSGFTYTGQKVLSTGGTFVNSQAQYDSISTGRFFSDGTLAPYSIRLDKLAVRYEQTNANALGEAIDYTATVTTRQPGQAAKRQTIKVNHPLDIAGTSVFLLGNGYAPHIIVRNAAGKVVSDETWPFQPTGDRGMTSLGVVKVTDTGDAQRQIGLNGFLYPTAVPLKAGGFESVFPSVGKAQTLVTLNAYVGNLGLDTGTPQNVYVLNTSHMKEIAGGKGNATKALELAIGQTKQLPDGLGSVTLAGVTRFAALDIHHDPSQLWVAGFVALAVLGLLTSLLVPRRRMWVRISEDEEDGLRADYAGLARGDDPGLERAVADLAAEHRRDLEAEGGVRPRAMAGV
jgi:cytochrome c biogenesis protein